MLERSCEITEDMNANSQDQGIGKFNALRPEQRSAILQTTFNNWFFINENICILSQISLKFITEGLVNNTPALVQIMA